MTTSTMYKTNKELFSKWQLTQADFFKRFRDKFTSIPIVKIVMNGGKIFSNMADELNRMPSYREFENKLKDVL